ncbi:hypothetical protein AALO_G00261300 [Alosa alosa]|uniref:Uncharacterized protein n=1 Tax=Alosa alosa TaxID=278164 RepID=A0AAV6FRH5_9TELE|nr:hypothetical protein AALO_G00261300 [Alosa alosa]
MTNPQKQPKCLEADTEALPSSLVISSEAPCLHHCPSSLTAGGCAASTLSTTLPMERRRSKNHGLRGKKVEYEDITAGVQDHVQAVTVSESAPIAQPTVQYADASSSLSVVFFPEMSRTGQEERVKHSCHPSEVDGCSNSPNPKRSSPDQRTSHAFRPSSITTLYMASDRPDKPNAQPEPADSTGPVVMEECREDEHRDEDGAEDEDDDDDDDEVVIRRGISNISISNNSSSRIITNSNSSRGNTSMVNSNSNSRGNTSMVNRNSSRLQSLDHQGTKQHDRTNRHNRRRVSRPSSSCHSAPWASRAPSRTALSAGRTSPANSACSESTLAVRHATWSSREGEVSTCVQPSARTCAAMRVLS